MKPIISPNSRIRCPDYFEIGDDSIIDDYCYFSTRVKIGNCSHIASGCSIAGGADFLFEIGNYSSLSAGVKVWCTSDDFVNDIVAIPPRDIGVLKTHLITGDVIMGDYTAVGSNSVIMPNNHIPDGTVIGSLSFVPPGYKFLSWSVYAGIPIRFLRKRNKENIFTQVENLNKFFRNRDA